MIVEDKEGMRIDSYLAERLDISRSKIQKLIKEEKVLVNGKVVNASYLVQLEDSIEIDDELNYLKIYKFATASAIFQHHDLSDFFYHPP